MGTERSSRLLWSAAGIWVLVAGVSLFAIANYGAQAGKQGEPPSQWSEELTSLLRQPSAEGVTKSPRLSKGGSLRENNSLRNSELSQGELIDRPKLVVFAHPLCPCTRATLWELERLANQFYNQFDTHVLFFEPTDPGKNAQLFDSSDLRAIARRLPGAILHTDLDGSMALHFGAYTSGQVLLYDSDGRLQFAGGVTPSRGHTGTNPGRSAIISALVGDAQVDPLAASLSPVYGCGLHDADKQDRKLNATPVSGIATPDSYSFSG